MSFLNYEQMRRKYRYREAEVLVMAGQILVSEGYYIKSISSSYQTIDRRKYGFNKLCEFRHPGGFDLILLDMDFMETGVEVKSVLGMSSYQSALGQCMVYLNSPDTKVKEAIIFAHRFESDRIYQQIRYDFDQTIARTGLPLKIKVMQRPLGSHGPKEICRRV